ncbi:DegT/DnrJ/EryC1/StrS family aminotransferase [Streptomyces anulatus]|nr:aminotransferase class I/II-fold pyridoxal phosphate-dependent enzyme [Streptomyces anulatus]
MGGWYTEAEHAALAQVLAEMPSWTDQYTRRHQEEFEKAFAAYTGAGFAVSVNSGGVALDLAMTCLDAEPGAEVISCAINFPGTHLAVLGAGFRLVLAEPDPHTLNLDPDEIARRMTPRTTAVLVTHMNGQPADLVAIESETTSRAAALGIGPPRIVVDAARAAGATTPLGPVGSGGWLTMFSFHRKKLMTTLGEGGMLTTDCEATAHRIRQLRSFGLGQTLGSSHRMTEFQAAVGSVQLKRLDTMNDQRIALARERTRLLTGTPGLHTPGERAGYRHVYYLYNVLLDAALPAGTRDRLRDALREEHAIGTVIANPPTYRVHPLIAKATAGQWPLPVAEDVASRLLCPALHPLMSPEDNTRTAEALTTWLRTAGAA